MDKQNTFFMNLSVLYRNTQKYFDKNLAQFDIGSGQIIFLFLINEHEGITMAQLTRMGEFDKGTTTKSVSKLEEQGYIEIRVEESDKRVKCLYTTEKANEIMNTLYEFRNACRAQIAQEVDFEAFEKQLEKVTTNSRMFLVGNNWDTVKIAGLQKMTLLDYPGLVACTIFTGGCNFKCPFCHNKDLVFLPENYSFYDPNDILDYLKKRKGILDGVCISGGEPLLQEGLVEFIQEIKKLGFKVKLDTNGNNPEKLKEIVESGLIDYVAMDIKNTPSKYAETIGVNASTFNIDSIQQSIDYLMHGTLEYEFRTTITRELHTKEDMEEIGKWIQGCKRYFLQQYVDGETVIQRRFTSYSAQEMEELKNLVEPFIPNVELRGIK